MRDDRILVAGGQGYIGSVLVQELSRRHYPVIVVDSGLMSTIRVGGDDITYVEGDVRDVSEWAGLLRDVTAVVDLAAVVGDPACDLDHDLAWDTNYLGTVHLAEACRRYHVGRFVFASTCSNYGLCVDGEADIQSALFPQSVYAMTKIHAEHHLLSARQGSLTPCILRFATVYGLSPRMRFDLAVNVMTARAALTGHIPVNDGNQWRPFLHVRDAAAAIVRALEVPASPDLPEIFNCGSSGENYRMRDVGDLISEEVPGAAVTTTQQLGDSRDYRVNFDPIRKHLDFFNRFAVRDGVREIRDAIGSGLFHDFDDEQYSDYKTLKARLGRADAEDPDRPAPNGWTPGLSLRVPATERGVRV